MVDILAMLPPELQSKCFTYMSHPVADIVRENRELIADNNILVKDLTFLQEYFPTLSFDDMVEEYLGQDEHSWLEELAYRLRSSNDRNAYRELFRRVKEAFELEGVDFTATRISV